MAVEVVLTPNFHLTSQPRPMFEGRYLQFYDISPDEQHFVMITKEKAILTQFNVILNWSEELKWKVPSGK